MNIKRVDDKKMEIHKKEKSTIKAKQTGKPKAKKMTIHAKDGIKNTARTGIGTARRKVISHVDGGEEIDGALMASQRAVSGTRKTVRSAKEMADIAKRIKRVNKGKKLARKKAVKQSKKIAKKVPKKVVKTTTKESAKFAAKETTKAATKVTGTVAGTVGTGPAGSLVGIAVGEAVGIKMDAADVKHTNRIRKLKYFRDKLQSQDMQTDSLGKLVKDLFKKKFSMVAKYVVKYMIIFLLLLLVLVAIVAVPVVAIVAVAYNSPLAIFLPPLESGDTVQSVSSAYMADFNREITSLATEHKDHDKGQIIYVDYEGTGTPNNLYDIVCVYMVKYGYENIAINMNETNKQNLKMVFDDMCTYTTETTTQKVKKKTKRTLNVKVTMKTYTDMISEYSFGTEQAEMLNQLMGSDSRAQLGFGTASNGGTSRTDAKSSLTDGEIKSITDKITDTKTKQVCTFALTKVGYPYSQQLRDSGNYYDCSSLAYYAWQSAGISIKYGGSNTAAAEAEYCAKNGKTVSPKDMKPGDLIFYSFTNNGRYKNISHVAIYIGNGKIVEAVDENHGVVYGNFYNKGLVMIGTPKKK